MTAHTPAQEEDPSARVGMTSWVEFKNLVDSVNLSKISVLSVLNPPTLFYSAQSDNAHIYL
jgi:hypothetical protein